MTTITDIDALLLSGPKEERLHWVSNFTVPTANEALLRIRTDDGIEGFGLANSYTDAMPILKVLRGGLLDRLIGASSSCWRSAPGSRCRPGKAR